jgi:hypothetical protein
MCSKTSTTFSSSSLPSACCLRKLKEECNPLTILTVCCIAFSILVILGATLLLTAQHQAWGVMTQFAKLIGTDVCGALLTSGIALGIVGVTLLIFRPKHSSCTTAASLESSYPPTPPPQPVPVKIPQQPPQFPQTQSDLTSLPTPLPQQAQLASTPSKTEEEKQKNQLTIPLPSSPPPILASESAPSSSTALSASSPQAQRIQIFIKTLQGATLTVNLERGVTVRSVIKQLQLSHQLGSFVLIFGGKQIFSTDDLGKSGDIDCIDFISQFGLQKESTLHLVLRDRAIVKDDEKIEKREVLIFFKTLSGDTFDGITLPLTGTLNDCCNVLVQKMGLNASLTIMRLFYGGQLITRPEFLAQNFFALQSNCGLLRADRVHAIPLRLTDDAAEEICNLFEKNRFPGFQKEFSVDKTIERIRTILWSVTDRLLRRREGASADDLDTQYRLLNQIIEDPAISPSAKAFLSALQSVVNAAYGIYAASVANSYDEICKLLKKILIPEGFLSPPPIENGVQIELQIGEKYCRVSKARLICMSSYFEGSLSGNFNTGTGENALFELGEKTSPFLLTYFEQGNAMDLKGLSWKELATLYENADALICNELSFLCQQEMIRRIRSKETITPDISETCKNVPLVMKALCIQLSQQLWTTEGVEGQIKEMKEKLTMPPPVREKKLKNDYVITLRMPGGRTQQIRASALIECDYYRSLIFGVWKDAANKDFKIPEEIPPEIFDYLENGSDNYKKLDSEGIKRVFPMADFLGIPELIYHFKLKTFDTLSDAYQKGWEKVFCETCAPLLNEIIEWANLD